MFRWFSAVLAAALMAMAAQSARAQSPEPADPIAAALGGMVAAPAPDKKPTPEAKAAPAIRVFSPSAIADILEREAPASKTSPTPKAPPTPKAAPVASSSEAATPPPGASPPRAAPAGKVALTPDGMMNVHFGKVSPGPRPDPIILKAEILLDRNHAPPGVIDGRAGGNFTKAIRTFEETHGLTVDGKLTQAVWDALGADNAAPVLMTYKITPEDAAHPFYPDLPSDYALLAKLPESGFHDAAEMFGTRFHMDKRFLQALNPGADLTLAGTGIIVANVTGPPLATPVDRIDVDKAKGQVLAYDAGGKLIVAYPATIGSEELPSPSGSYAVRAVAWHPNYTYDPKKNFLQGTNTSRLILPPGPNNPVGSVFIALTKPTFGIHGTPDPTKIDKTHSHGCVRLTNWNAEELAHLVRPGIPVNFLDPPGDNPADPLEGIISLSASGDPR